MKKILVVVALVMGVAMCQSASALPILLNGPYGVVILPANEGNEVIALTAAITAYNLANNPDLPPAGAIDLTPQLVGVGTNTGGTGHAITPASPLSIIINFGVERETYALMTWDGPNGGTLIYYVGLETGPVTFSSPFFGAVPGQDPGHQYGLSHYMFTGPGTSVPDGGATLILLGGALVGIGALRRKFRA